MAKGWRQLGTTPTNISGLQDPTLVNIERFEIHKTKVKVIYMHQFRSFRTVLLDNRVACEVVMVTVFK